MLSVLPTPIINIITDYAHTLFYIDELKKETSHIKRELDNFINLVYNYPGIDVARTTRFIYRVCNNFNCFGCDLLLFSKVTEKWYMGYCKSKESTLVNHLFKIKMDNMRIFGIINISKDFIYGEVSRTFINY